MSNNGNITTDKDQQVDSEEEIIPDTLHGILVNYIDDQLDDCVNLALRRKSRVKYKCMDIFSNLLAFGTSGGAIYLFKLKAVSHSSCTLTFTIPCDQGSIEVIRFLPSSHSDDLLITVGTSRGSLVIFRLAFSPGQEENPICSELYKAESFTNNRAIKLIEYDQDYLDSRCPFTKLYICDSANRLYILESSTIFGNKQTLRLFHSNHTPSLIFSVNDSKINQVSVFRSQLIISTDETTRLFNELTNELKIIGRKKRKEGFYGACFFDSNYRPTNILQATANGRQVGGYSSAYSSTASLENLDGLKVFVARPVFRLWQVNCRGEVMYTHQFEEQIKLNKFNQLIELHNEPLPDDAEDDPAEVLDKFLESKSSKKRTQLIKSDHFQKLVQIYSSTLGNLILSYTRHELFVVDPLRATLIVSHYQESPIIQVCSDENELFVWCLEDERDERQFKVKRLALLAPTQFVLELHRLHRYTSLVMFVQLFIELFRYKMALPLNGLGVITTEGGLLRNVLLNAWDMFTSQIVDEDEGEKLEEYCSGFKRIVEDIVDESRELRQSVDDIANSRFFLTMTNENIDRICTEPYASLISLDVSIKDLHTKHVIHFNKDAIERHKSIANLSQNVRQLGASNKRIDIQSTHDLTTAKDLNRQKRSVTEFKQNYKATKSLQELNRLEVKVERRRKVASGEEKLEKIKRSNSSNVRINESSVDILPSFKEKISRIPSRQTIKEEETEVSNGTCDEEDEEMKKLFMSSRCSHCRWPRPGSHLKSMTVKQQNQFKWIEANLMSNFEENILKIEELAFEYGLWVVFLKCLAFRNQTDLYITTCMLLDDIRLLDTEQFVIIHGGEVEIFNRLLVHIGRKAELLENFKSLKEVTSKDICLKCGGTLEIEALEEKVSQVKFEKDELKSENKFRFSLINLFDLFMARRNANLKRLISSLLKHPKLVESTQLHHMFYLKAIAAATFKANQSPLSRARFRAITSLRYESY